MSSNVAAELTVEIRGREVGLSSLLQKIEAQMRQADASGVRLAQTTSSTLASSQQRAANSALATAAAYSRLALAEGEPARAAAILRTALDANTSASERARVSLQATATRLESGATAFHQFGDAAKSSLLGIIGPAALATTAIAGAIRVVSSFGEAFKFKADLDSSTAAINLQIRGVRDANQVWSEATRFAHQYSITQQETNAILTSSTDVLRASKSSVTDLEAVLLRLQSRDISKPISEAARALRELQAGDTTSIKELFNIPAAAANRMKTEIAGGADAVQVLSSYLSTAGAGMEVLEQRTKGVAGKMNDLKVAQEDLVLAQAQFAQGPGLAILQTRIDATRVAARGLSGDFQGTGQAVTEMAARGGPAFDVLNTIFAGSLGSVRNLAQETLRLQGQQQQAALAAEQHTQAISLQSPAMVAAASSAEAARQALEKYGVELDKDSVQSDLSSVHTAELTLRKDQLARQAQIAAGALLASGNAGAAAAAQLANSSRDVDVLTAAYYRLAAARGAQTAANLANPQVNNLNVGRDADDVQAGKHRAATAALTARRQAAEQASAAEAHLSQIQGDTGPARRRLNLELETARARGDRTATANALIGIAQLDQAEEKLAKGRKGRTGGGAGAGGAAAQLNDQQKLNNTLLADQEKADTQLEDLQVSHLKKLQQIEQAAYDKRKEALDKFNQDRLDGEAGFYGRLGSVGSSGNAAVDQDLRHQLDARYQNAILAAQELAKSKGADVGDAFLQASSDAIAAEGAIQDKINKAQQEGNTGEAEYQAGVLALQKKADDERLRRIQEGGSAIEAERKSQIDAENTAYTEQSSHIETTANRAADVKTAAAVRAGKAVDAENAKLEKQAGLYDRIAGASGTPGGGAAAAPAAAPAPASGTPSRATATAVAPLDTGAIIDALAAVSRAVVGAIEANAAAITAAERDGSNRVVGAMGGRAFT